MKRKNLAVHQAKIDGLVAAFAAANGGKKPSVLILSKADAAQLPEQREQLPGSYDSMTVYVGRVGEATQVLEHDEG
jgi:hypothetical protein